MGSGPCELDVSMESAHKLAGQEMSFAQRQPIKPA